MLELDGARAGWKWIELKIFLVFFFEFHEILCEVLLEIQF